VCCSNAAALISVSQTVPFKALTSMLLGQLGSYTACWWLHSCVFRASEWQLSADGQRGAAGKPADVVWLSRGTLLW
jgi:hypothetical protein